MIPKKPAKKKQKNKKQPSLTIRIPTQKPFSARSLNETAKLMLSREIVKDEHGRYFIKLNKGDSSLHPTPKIPGRPEIFVTAQLTPVQKIIWEKHIKGKTKKPSIEQILKLLKNFK